MSEPRFVFRVVKPINELQATRDHELVYTPNNEIATIHVVQHMPPGFERHLLKHYAHLELTYQEPSVSSLSPRDFLFRALQRKMSA